MTCTPDNMPFTVAEIARHLEGEILGDAHTPLKSFAHADRAQPGDLTFAENDKFFARAEQSPASAIIFSGSGTSNSGKALIRVPNARIAFARALTLFFPETAIPPGIHPSVVIAKSARIDPGVYLGPNCVVGERSWIGSGAVLHAGDVVADDCKLGAGTVLFPNVTLYPGTELGQRVRVHAGSVIGADGFGYVLDGGIHRKVPQTGNVLVGDDVEIGANVTIDRGALGPTVIGKGSKIDNLVQIGHNVQIGEHCIVIAQAGIAGSAKLGNYVIVAGQAGIAGHITIGNKVTIAGQSGVMHDIPDGQSLWGTPALPDRATKRQMIAAQRLPQLLRRVSKIEKSLGLGGDSES
jgi:UDP-3-O-[3-hydroxymyristoyl] glucosamine N-acyltransferase